MPIVADAAVAVRADMSKFKQDVTSTGKQVDGLGKKLTGALNPKNVAGGLIAGVVGSQVIQVIEGATNAAAEFQDSVSATGVIFGEELVPQIEAWGEAAYENFGASKQQAIAAANQFAVFGKSAGLAGQELVDFSTEMVQLGGDLASFFGGTTEEAITAVGAALRGEAEPIRRYGVLLDDATLRQQAFEMGLISTTKNALTPQQRVLAAHAEILDQTTDAQGDFVRTSDGMANQQRMLAAQLENVNIELGEKLMPVMVELVTWVSQEGIPILRGLIDSFDELGQVVGGVIDVINPSGGVFPEFQDDLRGLDGALKDLNVTAEQSRPVFDHFNGDLHRGVEAMQDWIDRGLTFNEGLRELKSASFIAGQGLSALPQSVRDAMLATEAAAGESGVAGALSDPFTEGADTAVDEVENMYSRIAAEIKAAEDKLREAGGDAVQAWLDPQITTYEIARIEAELASKDFRENLRSENENILRDAEQRRLELTADLIELRNEQATQGEAMAQIARTKALLTSQFMRDGLKSKDPEIRALFRAWRDEARARLQELQDSARGYGFNIASELAAGMIVGKGLVVDAARQLATSARSQIAIESEPPDHNSPLFGITKWGGNLVDTYASGILDNLALSKAAGTALAASVVPGLAAGRVPLTTAATPAAVTGGGGNTYHVHLEDKLQARTVTEIGAALRRLGEAGLLPGSLTNDN